MVSGGVTGVFIVPVGVPFMAMRHRPSMECVRWCVGWGECIEVREGRGQMCSEVTSKPAQLGGFL